MILAASLFSGLVFGIGLIVSGMAGAIAVGALAFFIGGRRTLSLLGVKVNLPSARQIDRRLVGGSLLFGIGWGVAGFCPGPALVALGMGQAKAAVFVLAMIAGMLLFEALERARRPAALDGA